MCGFRAGFLFVERAAEQARGVVDEWVITHPRTAGSRMRFQELDFSGGNARASPERN